nr:MAG TPA: hypothetical protein [Caudoviricetes sp.]DAZ48567.1 MAG TPA: hypothetical protein [Caudoviricetes sp.]
MASLILSCSIILHKFCFCKDTLILKMWYYRITN